MFDKDAKAIRKESLLNKLFWKKLNIHMLNNKLHLNLIFYIKINSKLVTDLNIKHQTVKTFENMCPGVNKEVLDITPKA